MPRWDRGAASARSRRRCPRFPPPNWSTHAATTDPPRRPPDTGTRATRPAERTRDEGRSVLRRSGHAHAGRQPVAAQADDADRQPPGAVAHHAVLRALRAHRVHPLPRPRGPGRQGLLPRLPGDRLQRLRADEGRAARRHAQHRHQRLDHHLHRHRDGHRDRRAPASRASLPRGRRALPGQLRRRPHRRPDERPRRPVRPDTTPSRSSSPSSPRTPSTWSRPTTTAG